MPFFSDTQSAEILTWKYWQFTLEKRNVVFPHPISLNLSLTCALLHAACSKHARPTIRMTDETLMSVIKITLQWHFNQKMRGYYLYGCDVQLMWLWLKQLLQRVLVVFVAFISRLYLTWFEWIPPYEYLFRYADVSLSLCGNDSNSNVV